MLSRGSANPQAMLTARHRASGETDGVALQRPSAMLHRLRTHFRHAAFCAWMIAALTA